MLLMEEIKVVPNIRTISLLMTRTFAFRRRDILQALKPLKDVLKIFRSLIRLDQVGSLLKKILPDSSHYQWHRKMFQEGGGGVDLHLTGGVH